ncbi:hypothetical protein IHE45_08G022400 [Dioscorea alata]|nr:hypothetical protein IHE45_08G022400 [Dioscorea alata]KAH7673672.1 hypothetical protein IHE45_08G022400 [Dioscorea alata]
MPIFSLRRRISSKSFCARSDLFAIRKKNTSNLSQYSKSWMKKEKVKSNSKDQDQDQHMEPKNQQQPYRDVMYDSFGDAYGTRSDEEGFGGVYGRNQELSKENEPKPKHGENHEYDTSQGSEVKEKEKARHQPNVKSE